MRPSKGKSDTSRPAGPRLRAARRCETVEAISGDGRARPSRRTLPSRDLPEHRPCQPPPAPRIARKPPPGGQTIRSIDRTVGLDRLIDLRSFDPSVRAAGPSPPARTQPLPNDDRPASSKVKSSSARTKAGWRASPSRRRGCFSHIFWTRTRRHPDDRAVWGHLPNPGVKKNPASDALPGGPDAGPERRWEAARRLLLPFDKETSKYAGGASRGDRSLVGRPGPKGGAGRSSLPKRKRACHDNLQRPFARHRWR